MKGNFYHIYTFFNRYYILICKNNIKLKDKKFESYLISNLLFKQL